MADPGAVSETSLAEQISAEFAERLDLLEEARQITPLARRLTELAIAEIADELAVTFTEENAAPFVTHLAVALTRLNRFEREAAPSAVVDEEIRDRTREREVIQRVMEECEKLLDREVPESEIAYMTVHLCAILDDE
ncbi:PRD domain-containing protein [Microbispora sp. H11081]|uniref:PRD domain-containing protein n=1 Tax=Microbispora sp. H11081 TaxID=2729107 RepID=UPI00147404C2|nr:PRD domain-containing protein [Microbispora sp. H11081]